MKFPNKVTSYKQSIIPKILKLASILKGKDYTVSSLYEKVEKQITITEFIDALDCLFALGQINLHKEVLHYVERDAI